MSQQVDVVHQQFIRRVKSGDLPPLMGNAYREEASLSAKELVSIFESQVLSRQLDRSAKRLQAAGEGFYTIGSSGHEGMAAIAAAFRPNDMAFLHYRDAAFQIQRAKQVSREAIAESIAEDMLLSFAASADDPISGGRHKVLGSKALFIPPQTSTIASHLPKAVGAAYSVDLAKQFKPQKQVLLDDAVIICSFGDASANHSTAQGAINAASWAAFQGAPMPIVFICEDNGIGISTRTPSGWIESVFAQRKTLRYMPCNGLDMQDAFSAANEAAAYARAKQKPVFLHMKCVRLFGHAGPDAQSVYLSKQEIQSAETNDPLLFSARRLLEDTDLTASDILHIYQDAENKLMALEQHVITRPKLRNSAEVMQSIIPPRREKPNARTTTNDERNALFGRDINAMQLPQNMAKLIGWALTDLMSTHSEIILAGEDIGPKGGVYNVTAKLHDRFGAKRVINTLLDEQSILGLAIGLAHNGFIPIPEIQFLAYIHNAEDQIRGEAATLSFFSNGQFTNPMVIRIAGLGYQKGFGGHFHNDNSLAVLRDIPGIIVACPSNGEDAVLMLRECVRLAQQEQRVVVYIEPIALYMTRDLHTKDDGLWASQYVAPSEARSISMTEVGQYGEGDDLLIVTYGNGYYLSRQAHKILLDAHGISIKIIDLRWLTPLAEDAILKSIDKQLNILIVDECRRTGSLSESLMAMLLERGDPHLNIKQLTADDSFIALGKSATVTLPSCEGIVSAARKILGA